MGYRNKRSCTNHIVNLRIELSWNVFVEKPANTGSRTNHIVNLTLFRLERGGQGV